MEFKGTKGKWELNKGIKNNQEYFYSIFSGNYKVCDIKESSVLIKPKEAKYNALLISKAPEMLEMLVDIVNANNKGNLEHLNFYQIEQLIKEATEL